jgi:hypothetical protein
MLEALQAHVVDSVRTASPMPLSLRAPGGQCPGRFGPGMRGFIIHWRRMGMLWLAAFVVPVVQALVVCSPLTSPDSNSHQDLSPRGFVRSAGQSLGAVLGWHSSRTP